MTNYDGLLTNREFARLLLTERAKNGNTPPPSLDIPEDVLDEYAKECAELVVTMYVVAEVNGFDLDAKILDFRQHLWEEHLNGGK